MVKIQNKLNAEQLSVIHSDEQRIFVNAVPGSGKTTLVISYVVDLIKNKGVKPHKIRLCTFTNIAANTMKCRLKKQIGKQVEQVKISTIHGFAQTYLMNTEVIVAENMVSDDELEEFLDKNKLDKREFDKWECRPSFGRNKSLKFLKVYEYLEQNNLWTYDYCINKMIELLRNNKEELMKFRNKIEYLIIDEYQDCNSNQIELLRLLRNDSKSNKKFLFVGDTDQMIYEWRGAKATFSNKINEWFPNTKIMNLVKNYRSAISIVNKANLLINANIDRLPKSIEAMSEDKGRVSYTTYANEKQQALAIAKAVKNSDTNNIAILCAQHCECQFIENELINQGIDCFRVSGDKEATLPTNKPIIMTVFAAKGTEFDTVFVPYANSVNYTENRRNLFYVAITRAKKSLFISHYKSQKSHKNGRFCKKWDRTNLLDDMKL